MEELNGKTLILTGTSSGIGRALALELAQNGTNLVLNARRSAPLEEVSGACAALGVTVRHSAGSAAEAQTASRLVEIAASLGNFYGFIQVAGVLHPGPFLWELSDSSFREVFEASVLASHQIIRFAVPELLGRGRGVAVFFGSGASERSTPGIGAYSAAKAAEEHMAKQLAAEAPQITSFIYRPGVVETRMQQEARSARGGASETLQRIFRGYRDRGELITPEQAAGALVQILNNNPRRFHGRVATWRDGA